MMSLGTWKARSTKYQRFINLSNVFMLIVSNILLISRRSVLWIFKTKYFTKYFRLTSGHGITMPALCACWPLVFKHSLCLIMVSPFIIRNQDKIVKINLRKSCHILNERNLLLSRGLTSLIAIFLSSAFFVQIFSVFTAFELRNKINVERISTSYLNQENQENQ